MDLSNPKNDEQKAQPTTLPDDVENEKEIVIKAPVTLNNWYSSLLEKLCEDGFTGISSKVRETVIHFMTTKNRRNP